MSGFNIFPKLTPAEIEKLREKLGITYTVPRQAGRNNPCPCGSLREDGQPKKYEKCCGRIKQ